MGTKNGSLALVCAVLCGLAACSAPAAAPSLKANVLPPLPAPDRPVHDDVALGPGTEKPALRLTPDDRVTYDHAQELSRAGNVREAKRLIAKLLVAYPDQAQLVDDYNAMHAMLIAAGGAARTALEGQRPVVLPPPPANASKIHDARLEGAPVPKLTQRSKKKGDIVDSEGWFRANQITRPEYWIPPSPADFFFVDVDVQIGNVSAAFSGFGFLDQPRPAHVRAGDLPLWVPISFGTMPITNAIDSAPFTLAIYGGRILAVFDDAKKLHALFDFANYRHPPANEKGKAKIGSATITTPTTTRTADIEVETSTISLELRWAIAKGGTVFVEHMNRSSSKDNKGQNAYITAIDLDGGTVAWRSGPLIANAEMFGIAGGAVISGYGFSSEPDFLYVLDAATGATKQKIPVPSSPEDIVVSGSTIYVRTYDTDLVFDAK